MQIKKIIEYLCCRLMPIKKNCVFFLGLGGQYSDNVKYISQKLHEMNPETTIFWSISDKCNDKLPSYVVPIQEISYAAINLRFSCHVVVDCDMGVTVPYCLPLFKYTKWIIKRSKQLTISTWHGTPLKKILLDDVASNCRYTSRRRLLSDFIIAGCRFTKFVLIQSIQGNNEYSAFLTGTPRNDILFNHDIEYKKSIRDRLKLPRNKKIFLFAPTFRDNVEQSGGFQMKELRIKQILDLCTQYWGGEWIWVFRLHPRVLLSIDSSAYESSYIINGNNGDDMAEYLFCADILLTDYSSTMFDFMLTGRPCFLFAPDREHYEKQERGFYFNYDSLPFPIAYTNAQLIENIKTFDKIAYKRNVDQFLQDIGNVEDGKASERIAECIVHFIKTGEKRLNTVTGVERL